MCLCLRQPGRVSHPRPSSSRHGHAVGRRQRAATGGRWQGFAQVEIGEWDGTSVTFAARPSGTGITRPGTLLPGSEALGGRQRGSQRVGPATYSDRKAEPARRWRRERR